jgi:twitching motility protein PilT
MAFSPKNLASLLTVAIQHKASDIHIRCNEVPCLRIRGELIPIQTKTFTEEDITDIIKIITEKERNRIDIDKILELDGAIMFIDILVILELLCELLELKFQV